MAERVKQLREQCGWTQAELAKLLSITRSSMNAWKLEISVPSTQYLVELASLFKISTDYLLGINATATVSVTDLTEADAHLVHALIAHLKNKEYK